MLNLYWQTDFGAFWSILVNALWYLSSNHLGGAIKSPRELCTLSVAEVWSMLPQWEVWFHKWTVRVRNDCVYLHQFSISGSLCSASELMMYGLFERRRWRNALCLLNGVVIWLVEIWKFILNKSRDGNLELLNIDPISLYCLYTVCVREILFVSSAEKWNVEVTALCSKPILLLLRQYQFT